MTDLWLDRLNHETVLIIELKLISKTALTIEMVVAKFTISTVSAVATLTLWLSVCRTVGWGSCNSWGATSAFRLIWEKQPLLCESVRGPTASRITWILSAVKSDLWPLLGWRDLKSNFDSTLCTSQFNIWKQLYQLCQRLPLYIKKNWPILLYSICI